MMVLDNNVPAIEPVSLDEARTHLRVDVVGGAHPEDALIGGLISAAREHVEQNCRIVIAERPLMVAMDAFPSGSIDLGVWPVKSITAVRYEAFPNSYMALPSSYYALDQFAKPAKVKQLTDWPHSPGGENSVVVELVAGMAEVPKTLKQAMLLLIGHWYENREAVNVAGSGVVPTELPKGVDALLAPHRLGQGV